LGSCRRLPRVRAAMAFIQGAAQGLCGAPLLAICPCVHSPLLTIHAYMRAFTGQAPLLTMYMRAFTGPTTQRWKAAGGFVPQLRRHIARDG